MRKRRSEKVQSANRIIDKRRSRDHHRSSDRDPISEIKRSEMPGEIERLGDGIEVTHHGANVLTRILGRPQLFQLLDKLLEGFK